MKERSHLEVALDAQHLTLRGTGVDVEPTRLSGHVMLYLAEDMPLKEITLQFRGKARIPIPSSESLLTTTASSVSYVVCHHDWSFLEGDKKHARTVKAGRHLFPFHLQIGGSLPSTIDTSKFGGACVCYKLRAIAVRPGFSHNLQAIVPIYIDRSFSPEALEYQQTLEIENTWPEKIMYSVVVPHKAWAAGDKLTALLKFSPIAKGVHVTHIRTSIHETTKIYARSGAQENTQIVASIRHDIVDGKPVVVDSRRSPSQSGSSSRSSNSIAGPSTAVATNVPPSPQPPSSGASSLFHSSSSHHLPSGSSTPSSDLDGPDTDDNDDLVTAITLPIPARFITPTHSVEPIVITHRIRWSALIRNRDGHTSELRCSLPIHVLDHRLLEEARSFSAPTRRLVLGSSEFPPEEEGDRELPSYAAHVRDRVANMFLPEAVTVRVNNPWINHASSPQPGHDASDTFFSPPASRARSGHSTPLEPHHLSQLPHAPGPEGVATLDLLNSELLLSLSDSPLRREFFTPESRTPTSDQASLESSQPQSRNRSRPASPDGSHHDSTTVHHGNGHARNLHNLIRATMKPFTALSHNHSLFPRHGGHHSHPDPHIHHPRSHLAHEAASAGHHPERPRTVPAPDHVDGAGLLHRMLTEVPDYSIASRGFIGGVPPLESTRGLPSYEEAEAARGVARRATSSDTDLPVGVAGGVALDGASSSGGRREESASQVERCYSLPSSAA
ncbi:hypothetical protein P691DRAFT_674036 [Macrolepiota fuliginosa MF-IS2]|uniref:Arrestin C-terminal-like domain-containing protein n=1 Tax=Macrolepiota fuliginosa MF-IS2 TaxID=1400762 RepID=A0A9P5XA65_9AGAR|nr:hypothetical protein P691DRAFT_674036 [Macrolepiota fuliginosa MF-IS2]